MDLCPQLDLVDTEALHDKKIILWFVNKLNERIHIFFFRPIITLNGVFDIMIVISNPRLFCITYGAASILFESGISAVIASLNALPKLVKTSKAVFVIFKLFTFSSSNHGLYLVPIADSTSTGSINGSHRANRLKYFTENVNIIELENSKTLKLNVSTTLTLELQLLTEPLNVHSVNNIGIVLVPIPASMVKTIEGIDIIQTSLFFKTGNSSSLSKLLASTPNSVIFQSSKGLFILHINMLAILGSFSNIELNNSNLANVLISCDWDLFFSTSTVTLISNKTNKNIKIKEKLNMIFFESA
ncbi:hypothetical protein AGLY_007729 [Aphis glycines]|uniref:Uncharacterized protein n=1 Tax=Aphis glycines TaxID=307491 RepID=A0A6G0TN10_APHGL|nr:hypothetical protein AGLY_007729 [Aphis glycines]